MSPDSRVSVLILSAKSSGSSALQRLLTDGGAQTVAWTPHQEQETLYWTKAASALSWPQVEMADSVVPYTREVAIDQLRLLLARNLPTWKQPASLEDLVVQGWGALVNKFGPIFVEKSPHHLHELSAVNLAVEACRSLPGVQLRVIGLVRDPMDTLYSMWNRWRFRPTVHELEWSSAYSNLLQLQRLLGPDELQIIRYEDLVSNTATADAVGEFVGLRVDPQSLHASSLQRWRTDPNWGHVMSPSVLSVAAAFGYSAYPPVTAGARLRWAVVQQTLFGHRRARQRVGALRQRLGELISQA